MDVLIAVVAVALDLSLFTQLSDAPDQTSWVSRDIPPALIIGAGLIAVIPLSFRRLAPTAVCLIVAGQAALVTVTLGSRPLVTVLVALYTAAVWSDRVRARVCLAAVLAAHALAIGYEASFTGSGLSAFAVTAVALVYGLLDIATWAAGRWGSSAAARARARELEASRAALAAAAVDAERLRIARELHDIVAHAVTVMVLQSAGASRMAVKNPELAAGAMRAVENTGKQAVAELRRLLEVLRAEDTAHADGDGVVDEFRGTSRLANLDDLVAQIRSIGIDVAVQQTGTPCPLDPSVDLAAYRVIQEALTNVNKHAGAGAVARVHLAWEPSELVIEVVDDGQVNAGIEHLASGYGLVGLAERVKLVGGRLESGPRPDGGFRVRAVLPTSGSDPGDTDRRHPGEPELDAVTIRILLVDDEQLVRTGLAMILGVEDDLEVVGFASDGEDAVGRASELRPDVVVMDVRMPRLDGVEATKRILADLEGSTAVLMLTTYNVDAAVRAALRAGASGYVLKDAAPDELVGAVRAVADGEAWLDPAVAKTLLDDFKNQQATVPSPTGTPELTPREREVLRLVAHGLSNSEIAEFFTIAETTVKTHVSRILIKLGLRDRAQAVAVAYRRHVLEPDDPLPPRR